MRYGVVVTTGDPRTIVELAIEAEDAGWDGVFYFDAIAIGSMELYDPWVVLAAIAERTDRVRIGAILTPPSRRRPWKLAREAMTLDRLSGGRLDLPVGLGTLDDAAFGNVGEPTDARTRAELLDEALDILEGLWSGQPFAYAGQHYRFGEMTFLPTRSNGRGSRSGSPVRGRASARCAEPFGGRDPSLAHDANGRLINLTPEHVRAIADYVARERPSVAGQRPFDIVAEGTTPADDPGAAAAVVNSGPRPVQRGGRRRRGRAQLWRRSVDGSVQDRRVLGDNRTGRGESFTTWPSCAPMRYG